MAPRQSLNVAQPQFKAMTFLRPKNKAIYYVFTVSNIVSLAAVPITHQEIITEYRRV